MALERTVIGTFPKGPDVETRVSVVDVDGEKLVELADFILSKDEYGRGYHFPLSHNALARQALDKVDSVTIFAPDES